MNSSASPITLPNFLEDIVTHSGLPTAWARDRLCRLIREKGFHPEHITLAEFRELLALFLQDTLLEVNSQLEKD